MKNTNMGRARIWPTRPTIKGQILSTLMTHDPGTWLKSTVIITMVNQRWAMLTKLYYCMSKLVFSNIIQKHTRKPWLDCPCIWSPLMRALTCWIMIMRSLVHPGLHKVQFLGTMLEREEFQMIEARCFSLGQCPPETALGCLRVHLKLTCSESKLNLHSVSCKIHDTQAVKATYPQVFHKHVFLWKVVECSFCVKWSSHGP